MFPLLQVIKIEKIFSADQGCTRPVQVKLENGAEGILKYSLNQQGEIVLFNEFISRATPHRKLCAENVTAW